MKKFIYLGMPLAAILAAAILIYIDSRSLEGEPAAVHQHSHTTNLPAGPEGEELARILEIENILEDLEDARLAIAFLGEIAQINIRNERYDGAGDATARLASITQEFEDWKQAGDYFFEWLSYEEKLERQFHFASRAISAYQQALEVKPSDPDTYAVIGAVYGQMADYTNSELFLRKALDVEPDHLFANFNMGVILHETENKNKSISYLRRSLELARDTEYYGTVFGYLSQIQNEL